MYLKSLHPTIDVPTSVEAVDETVTVAVRVNLENRSDDAIVIASPEGDDPYFVQVFDEKQREISRNRDRSAVVDQHVSVTIAAHHSHNHVFEIDVPSKKLKDGHRYWVRAVLYEQSADDIFVAIKPPKKKAKASEGAKRTSKSSEKSKTKKKASKKTSTKKSASKRKTKKKASRKKTA